MLDIKWEIIHPCRACQILSAQEGMSQLPSVGFTAISKGWWLGFPPFMAFPTVALRKHFATRPSISQAEKTWQGRLWDDPHRSIVQGSALRLSINAWYMWCRVTIAATVSLQNQILSHVPIYEQVQFTIILEKDVSKLNLLGWYYVETKTYVTSLNYVFWVHNIFHNCLFLVKNLSFFMVPNLGIVPWRNLENHPYLVPRFFQLKNTFLVRGCSS